MTESHDVSGLSAHSMNITPQRGGAIKARQTRPIVSGSGLQSSNGEQRRQQITVRSHGKADTADEGHAVHQPVTQSEGMTATRVPPCSTTLEDLALHACKFQKTCSVVSDSAESDVTVAACNESMQIRPQPPLLDATAFANFTQSQHPPVEARQQCRHTRPAVGQVLQLVLQGMASPACLNSELGAAITDKLAGVLDAAEIDARESVNTGMSLAANKLLSQLAKLTEENQQLKASAVQTEQQLQIKDSELLLLSASVSDRDRTITKQEEDIKSYQSLAQSYEDMYLNVTTRARMSPTWLDEAMEVPVVRLSAESIGAARTSKDNRQVQEKQDDEHEHEHDEHEDDDELERLNDDGDVMEIMMTNDIRKYGVEKTSQRWVRPLDHRTRPLSRPPSLFYWIDRPQTTQPTLTCLRIPGALQACHQFIFHHLAIKDASVFPPAEDGRMYS